MGNGTAQGGIHVGLGSSSFKQEYSTDTNTYAGGSLSSSGTVTILAGSKNTAKGNIHATGETMQGKDVTLAASNNIILDAGKNTQTETNNYSSKGASIGVTVGIGGINNVDASFSKEKDQGTTEKVVHTGTNIMASGTLTTISGKDTNIIGSQVGGDTVTINAGGNLTIESLQDTETYRGHSSSSGASISSDVSGTGLLHNTSSSASFSKGSMNSDYASVTNQAGIYAGNGGFQINVADNTHLTGGIIDSTADAGKNSLTTGTLTMEDIQNKADYDVKNVGVSYTHSGTLEEKKDTYNKNGLIPSLSPGAKNEASSTTHAAIGQGTITTTKEQIDLSQINRDTQHSLNELGKIFDKKKIEEKQELAKLFAKNADELLHDFSKDGSIDKTLAHGLVVEIASQIANGNPAAAQWISAALGATVNAVTGGNANTGAMVAQTGTQWNYYGKRRDDAGNMLAVGKVAAILQNDGTYQYVINVNGKDKPISRDEIPQHSSVWIENPNDPGNGQTWIINRENGGDAYFSGTFSDITFNDKTNTAIFSGLNSEDWDEMSSIIPDFHTVANKGNDSFDFGKSIVTNITVTNASLPADLLGKYSSVKALGHSSQALGAVWTLNQDFHDYEGENLAKALGIDSLGTAIGIGTTYGLTTFTTLAGVAIGESVAGPEGAIKGGIYGTVLGTYGGGLFIGIGTDYSTNFFKKYFDVESTEKDIRTQKDKEKK
ncbi:hemagglutinin repeat-containing protein [Megasphaera cerevisiae]|uniref:hemagglutinin repeat-containing protein n=1 Tax=Megasphaera cerevisiae TaxID=39029 RepID=UPI000ADB0530|nr:hemagglutinin repeat-containing protein [Megasphaera cerevisiae]